MDFTEWLALLAVNGWIMLCGFWTLDKRRVLWQRIGLTLLIGLAWPLLLLLLVLAPFIILGYKLISWKLPPVDDSAP